MVESAKYEVVRKLDKVEIRRYPSLITARVCGENEGFNVLFRFISGKNNQKVKVKMTAPVVSEQIEMTTPIMKDASCIAFVMPENFDLETTPEPLDKRVKITRDFRQICRCATVFWSLVRIQFQCQIQGTS